MNNTTLEFVNATISQTLPVAPTETVAIASATINWVPIALAGGCIIFIVVALLAVQLYFKYLKSRSDNSPV